MPEFKDHTLWVELPSKARTEYKRLKRDLLAQLDSGDVLAMNSASAYQKMKQLVNGAVYDTERKVHEVHDEKLEALDELISELNGKPLLVFYQFKHDAARIQAYIQKRHRGWPPIPSFGGHTRSKDAEQILKDWNADRLPVLLVQVQAASHGLNMQEGSCQRVAFFGLPESLDVFEQAWRRVCRQGVKGETFFLYKFLALDSVDGIIDARLDSRNRDQRSFLNALRQHALAA